MADYLNPKNKKVDANQALIRSYDEDKNRLRVDAEVSATIGSVDVIIDAASGDNIAISDGVDTLAINGDGSINVNVQDITLDHLNDSVETFQANHDDMNVNANIQVGNADASLLNPVPVVIAGTSSGIVKAVFNSVTNVAVGVQTNIASYTVPAGKTAKLQYISASSDNVSEYEVYINGVIVDKKRSTLTVFNVEFRYDAFPLVAADLVVIKGLSNRPTVTDYEARIQVEEI